MTRSQSSAPESKTEPGLRQHVQSCIADIRAGKMVILVDDEDRENEGDLVFAAEKVTPDLVNFMAKYGRGLICVTLTERQVERLELPMMALPQWRGGPPLGTAFTLSIEARAGVTTGISAADRSHTIAVAVSESTGPGDIVSPGHVFPLKAQRDGVLVRTGQTEGSVDLARLAGLNPSGVICEIINDDGTMARMPDLKLFAKEHGLKIISIADLITYRLQTETLVTRVQQAELTLHQTGGAWKASTYKGVGLPGELLALVFGEPPPQGALCLIHFANSVTDLFAKSGSREPALARAFKRIEAEGAGAVVFIEGSTSLSSQLAALGQAEAGRCAADGSHGLALAAQVLRELGLRGIRVIADEPRKLAGLSSYLEVLDTLTL